MMMQVVRLQRLSNCISFLLLAAEWSPFNMHAKAQGQREVPKKSLLSLLADRTQRFHFDQEHPGVGQRLSAHTNTQWVPQTNCLLIVISYHLKWYNQSPWNVNQTNKPFDLLNNRFMPCAGLKRVVASAKCYRRRVSAGWHGECGKYNYKPGAMERANALADRTKQWEEIYGKKCYLGSIIYSSQMDRVIECMGLNQATASGT